MCGKDGKLRLLCQVPGGKVRSFLLRVWREETGEEVLKEWVSSNLFQSYPLPEGRYRVTVRAWGDLDPGGITKWIRVSGGRTRSLQLLFQGEPRRPPQVRVQFTLRDGHYPAITSLNGGILVCRRITL